MKSIIERKLLICLWVASAVLMLLVGGCGDEQLDKCKDACSKLKVCDSAEEGGSGALDDIWLSSCQEGCEDADEIEITLVDCLLDTPCVDESPECTEQGECNDIFMQCGAGSF